MRTLGQEFTTTRTDTTGWAVATRLLRPWNGSSVVHIRLYPSDWSDLVGGDRDPVSTIECSLRVCSIGKDRDRDPDLRSLGSFRFNWTLYFGPWLLPCWKWRSQGTQKGERRTHRVRRTKSQQTLSPSTCAYHNVYKMIFTRHIRTKVTFGSVGSDQPCSPRRVDRIQIRRIRIWIRPIERVRIQWIRWIGIPILPIEHAPTCRIQCYMKKYSPYENCSCVSYQCTPTKGQEPRVVPRVMYSWWYRPVKTRVCTIPGQEGTRVPGGHCCVHFQRGWALGLAQICSGRFDILAANFARSLSIFCLALPFVSDILLHFAPALWQKWLRMNRLLW